MSDIREALVDVTTSLHMEFISKKEQLAMCDKAAKDVKELLVAGQQNECRKDKAPDWWQSQMRVALRRAMREGVSDGADTADGQDADAEDEEGQEEDAGEADGEGDEEEDGGDDEGGDEEEDEEMEGDEEDEEGDGEEQAEEEDEGDVSKKLATAEKRESGHVSKPNASKKGDTSSCLKRPSASLQTGDSKKAKTGEKAADSGEVLGLSDTHHPHSRRGHHSHHSHHSQHSHHNHHDHHNHNSHPGLHSNGDQRNTFGCTRGAVHLRLRSRHQRGMEEESGGSEIQPWGGCDRDVCAARIPPHRPHVGKV